MQLITVLTLAAAALPTAFAFCCTGVAGQKCADGTKATPCCATESCNIFCCACGGHCRTNGKRELQSAEAIFSRELDSTQAFTMADTDASGNVTLSQYLSYMKVDGEPAIWVDWFNKHDANADGVITPDEMFTQD